MSEAGYVEAPRGYGSMLVTAVLMGAAIGTDGAIGGLAAHWVAWLVAAAILLGVHALFIHAARVNKTLTITADEVRIGEETLPREQLAAASAGIADKDLPVLGWPAGAPSKLDGVTVRLHDDRQAIVPTRHPEDVLGALGLGVGDDTDVRSATSADLPVLGEIDERAEALFRVAGLALPPLAFDEDWDAAAAVFVAGRPPVGFVRVDVVDGLAHLTEVAVLPGSMKRGVGSQLIEAACGWARAQGHGAITLTTYADVAWNAPMYARRGWVESDALGPGLAAVRDREIDNGLDGVGRRIVMRREL